MYAYSTVETEHVAKVQEISPSAARGQSRNTDADSSISNKNKTKRKPPAPFQETESEHLQEYPGLSRSELSHRSHGWQEEMTDETSEGLELLPRRLAAYLFAMIFIISNN